jgi:hypothetical protein
MVSPRLTSAGLLFIFLAGVMCLCDTASYQHLTAPGPAIPLESQQVTTEADPDAVWSGERGTPMVAYTVTLLFASIGIVLYLALGYARTLRPSSVRPVSGGYPRATAPLNARAPVRTQLQIFLL